MDPGDAQMVRGRRICISAAGVLSICLLALAAATYARDRKPLPDPSQMAHFFRAAPHSVPSMSQTPEPASLILLGSGFLFIGAVLRRRDKAVSKTQDNAASNFSLLGK